MVVYDDLTGHICKVTKIIVKSGNFGIIIKDKYLDGYRHPWELSNVPFFLDYFSNTLRGYPVWYIYVDGHIVGYERLLNDAKRELNRLKKKYAHTSIGRDINCLNTNML
jgi:hypothetical protein